MIMFSCLILLLSDIGLKNSISFTLIGEPFFSADGASENEPNVYFTLVETRIIDTELLTDQFTSSLLTVQKQ